MLLISKNFIDEVMADLPSLVCLPHQSAVRATSFLLRIYASHVYSAVAIVVTLDCKSEWTSDIFQLASMASR